MRRFGHRVCACAAMLLLACSGTDDARTDSNVAAEASVAGSPGGAGSTGSAASAADSGGRAGAAAASDAGASGAPSAGTGGAQAAASAGSPALTPVAGAGGAGAAGAPAAGGGGASGAAAVGGMIAAAGTGSTAGGAFILTPVDFPMYGEELTFPETANPPTNQSPEFTWTGVPAEAKTLALAFRDLGNSAVKWIIWDMPPSLMHIPSGIEPVAMPSEIPGSSQLGSLDNQGYAGPGMGARQYDFTLWALDTDKLPVTARMTTVQIHELLEMHELSKTPPVLLRNTRNL